MRYGLRLRFGFEVLILYPGANYHARFHSVYDLAMLDSTRSSCRKGVQVCILHSFPFIITSDMVQDGVPK